MVDVVDSLAALVAGCLRTRPRVAVAVDGPDAAGKTTFADSLVDALPAPVVRASIDGFHHPREVRLARGSLSPEGYYLDSFDYAALDHELLQPFATGSTHVRTRVHDHAHERAAVTEARDVPETAVLVVDGVFLLRPGLRDRWDVALHLHVPPEETLRRALVRDLGLFGSEEAVRERYTQRYLPGQALYVADADPWAHADLVVDTTSPAEPRIVRVSSRATSSRNGEARRTPSP